MKIDVDRMKGGKDVDKRLRGGKESGIPWFAFLDAKGKVLATSEGPKGNVGFPFEPQEIAHFTSMLKATAKRIAPEQIEFLEKALQDNAAKAKSARSG